MRAAEAIEYARVLVGDEHGDVNTDAKMLLHLNRTLRDISSRSRCLREGLYLAATPGQSYYGLPEGFLEIDIAAWQQSNGNYLPLTPITMNVASWVNHNSTAGRPRYYDIYGRAAIERVIETVHRIGVVPPADGAIDAIELAGSASVRMLRGDTIINISDGSSTGRVAFVREVLNADDNSVRQVIGYTELQNGTRTMLQEGDQVRITSPGTPLHALVISPVPNDAGMAGHEALFLYASRVHREITRQHISDENDNIELDIEFERALLEYLSYQMRRDELGASATESQAQHVIAETAYRDALPDVLKRIRAWKVAWHRRQGIPERATLNAPVRIHYPIGIGGEVIV